MSGITKLSYKAVYRAAKTPTTPANTPAATTVILGMIWAPAPSKGEKASAPLGVATREDEDAEGVVMAPLRAMEDEGVAIMLATLAWLLWADASLSSVVESEGVLEP